MQNRNHPTIALPARGPTARATKRIFSTRDATARAITHTLPVWTPGKGDAFRMSIVCLVCGIFGSLVTAI